MDILLCLSEDVFYKKEKKNERHFKRHLLVSSSNSCPAAWMRNIGDLCWSALDCRQFYEIVGGNLIW